MFCFNHAAIPHYQNINPNPLTEEPYRDKPSVDDINKALSRLTPKGKVLARSIALVASILFSMIAVTFSRLVRSSMPLRILLTLFYGSIGATTLSAYRSDQNAIDHLQKKIKSLFDEYTAEFIHLSKRYENLITLKRHDFDLIKSYCKQQTINKEECFELHYEIREETHFKLGGGDIGTWSVTPLKLEEVCKVTNSEEVIGKYKPWVDLLIDSAKDKRIPQAFLSLIGEMAGFKSALGFRCSFLGKAVNCTYEFGEGGYICCRYAGRKGNTKIKTPAECLAFMEREFSKNPT